MKKKEMYEYMGSMQQMAYVRSLKYDEGQASEMKAGHLRLMSIPTPDWV